MAYKVVFRIIDANINRAQEAFRVIEDWFRFNSIERFASEFRGLRHNFALLANRIRLNFPNLIFSRDINLDSGKNNDHSSYGSVEDLLKANFSRLKESLRSIEENLRLLNCNNISDMCQELRFAVYQFEKEFVVVLPFLHRKRVFCDTFTRLYLIFDLDLILKLGKNPEDLASSLLSAGVDILQLRFSSNIADRFVLELAQKLIASHRDKLIFVNNRADLAYLSGAHLHIGQTDIFAENAREILGNDVIVGLSCHNDSQISRAQEVSVDYFTIGPIFPTLTKPDYDVVGEELIQRWYNKKTKPFVVIGGINLERTSRLLKYSPWAICVCRDILTSSCPEERVLSYVNLLRRKAYDTTRNSAK